MTQTQQAQLFDERYQQALQAAQQAEGVRWTPCLPIGGEADYRYSACFKDMTGSTVLTVKKLRTILTGAGFELASTGSDDSELDAAFTLPGTPYTLSMTHTAARLHWDADQAERGPVAPREGINHPALPYALMSPSQFAHLQALKIVMAAYPDADRSGDEAKVEACGEASEQDARLCLNVLLKRQQVMAALAELYFIGESGILTKLDAQARFVSDTQEAALNVHGARGDPTLTFTKQSDVRYTARDRRDFPGYELRYDLLPAPGDTYRVQVTASRLKDVVAPQGQ